MHKPRNSWGLFMAGLFIIASCQGPLNVMQRQEIPTMFPEVPELPTTPAVEPTRYIDITNGIFIGGSLFFHSERPELNHFRYIKNVPIRLAQVEERMEEALQEEEIYDASGNLISSGTVTAPKKTYLEVPESVLVGDFIIDEITNEKISFDYALYDVNHNVVKRKENVGLTIGAEYDLDENGTPDLRYQEFNQNSRRGFEGVRELVFISSKDHLSTTMHKSPDDPDFPLPSGLVGLNPSGRMILRSDAFKVLELTADSLTMTGTDIPDLTPGDYILGGEEPTIYGVSDVQRNNDVITYSIVKVTVQTAYEVMNLEIQGNAKDLATRYASSRRGMSESSRALNISLLNSSGTMAMAVPVPPQGSSTQDQAVYANLKYMFDMSLNLDTQFNVSFTDVGFATQFWIGAKASTEIEAYIKTHFYQEFSFLIAEPSFTFLVGPVPVDLGAQISVGTEMEIGGAGYLHAGGGFDAKLGFDAGGSVGVEWDWLNTRIRTSGYARPINEFSSYIIGPDFMYQGKAALRPFFEVRPKLTIAKVVSGSVRLRSYLEGAVEVISNDNEGTTADFILSAGIKGLEPMLAIGVDFLGFKAEKALLKGGQLFDARTELMKKQLFFARPPLPQVSPPAIQLAGGSYNGAQSITIVPSDPASQIRYTLNGSEPTSTIGTLYTGPFTLNSSATVKAVAFKEGHLNSSVVNQAYSILYYVSDPIISPNSGVFTSAQSISMSTTTPGAEIRYTLDGTPPAADRGMVYLSPFFVTDTRQVRAIALKQGWEPSAVISRDYTITGKVQTPSPSVAGGTYQTTQTVAISTGTAGAVIRYTLDGSVPTASSGLVYTSPISIASTSILKAAAFKADWESSDLMQATYTITGKVADPIFSPAPGTINISASSAPSIKVTITTGTPGAIIRYTTDGSEPTPSSTAYTGVLTLTNNQTLRAKAMLAEWGDSGVTGGAYTLKLAQPQMSLPGGTYSENQTTRIVVPTGTQVRYTMDGSDPSATAGILYLGEDISLLNGNAYTIKSLAYASGCSPSDITMVSYSLGQVSDVTLSVGSAAPGTYSNDLSAGLTAFPGDAEIRYTLDGSVPTQTSGTIFSTPLSLTGAHAVGNKVTLKARAFKSGVGTGYSANVSTFTYTLAAAIPTSNQAGGLQSVNPLSISLSTGTTGATIWYTTNGTDPVPGTATQYSGPFGITRNTTIKALASKNGYANSGIFSRSYTFAAAGVGFSQPAGTYINSVSVALTAQTSGASIRYTTDGTTPSETNGTLYSGALTLTSTTTVKAVEYIPGLLNASAVATRIFTLKAATPTVSQAGGEFNSDFSVTLSTTTSGADIYYILGAAGAVRYTGAIPITQSTILRAYTVRAGMVNSDETSQQSYSLKVKAPYFGGSTAASENSNTVTIHCETPGATIYYGIGSTSPVTPYTGPITLNQSDYVTAVAGKSGWNSSGQTTSGTYLVRSPAPMPSLGSGTYVGAQTITVSATAGDSIRYTSDNSNPTATHGILYSGPIVISGPLTLKFVAYGDKRGESTIVERIYNIKTTAPSLDKTSGTYLGFVDVTVTNNHPGSTLYYTTNGASPTTSSAILDPGTHRFYADTNLKVIARFGEMESSEIVAGNYTVTGRGPLKGYWLEGSAAYTGGGTPKFSLSIINNTTGAIIRTISGSTVNKYYYESLFEVLTFTNGDMIQPGDYFVITGFATSGSVNRKLVFNQAGEKYITDTPDNVLHEESFHRGTYYKFYYDGNSISYQITSP